MVDSRFSTRPRQTLKEWVREKLGSMRPMHWFVVAVVLLMLSATTFAILVNSGGAKQRPGDGEGTDGDDGDDGRRGGAAPPGDDPGDDPHEDDGDDPDRNDPPRRPRDPSPADDATGISFSGVNLGWTGGDPDGTNPSYMVLLIKGEGVPTTGVCNWKTLTLCASGTLEPSTTYSWQVIARDAEDLTLVTQGPVWSFITKGEDDPNEPPETPHSPSPADDGGGQSHPTLSLAWQSIDPDGTDPEFEVYVDVANPPVKPACAWSTSHSCAAANLDPDMTYYWKVVARDAEDHDVTVEGPVWRFKTGEAPNVPPYEPSNPGPADGTEFWPADELTLTWQGGDPNAGDTVQYRVLYGTTDPPTQEACNWSTSTSCTISNLDPQTWHYWQVTAKDNHDEETPGPVWSFKTGDGEGGADPCEELGINCEGNPV